MTVSHSQDFEPTLDACRECYGVSVDYGDRAMYLVNGVLLQTLVSPVCVDYSYSVIITWPFHFPPLPGRGAAVHGAVRQAGDRGMGTR